MGRSGQWPVAGSQWAVVSDQQVEQSQGAEAGASAENCVPKLELGNEEEGSRRFQYVPAKP